MVNGEPGLNKRPKLGTANSALIGGLWAVVTAAITITKWHFFRMRIVVAGHGPAIRSDDQECCHGLAPGSRGEALRHSGTKPTAPFAACGQDDTSVERPSRLVRQMSHARALRRKHLLGESRSRECLQHGGVTGGGLSARSFSFWPERWRPMRAFRDAIPPAPASGWIAVPRRSSAEQANGRAETWRSASSLRLPPPRKLPAN